MAVTYIVFSGVRVGCSIEEFDLSTQKKLGDTVLKELFPFLDKISMSTTRIRMATRTT